MKVPPSTIYWSGWVHVLLTPPTLLGPICQIRAEVVYVGEALTSLVPFFIQEGSQLSGGWWPFLAPFRLIYQVGAVGTFPCISSEGDYSFVPVLQAQPCITLQTN